jgi:hypothetical protein
MLTDMSDEQTLILWNVNRTKCDNKLRELATVCLPWHQLTETSILFDDVGISAFQSCVVVDLWQSVSEWRLLLSECVVLCRRENVGACIGALSIREFLASKQISVQEHPPCSLDLAPSDFILFPKIKEMLKGRYFNDIIDIRNNTTAALKAIHKTSSKVV